METKKLKQKYLKNPNKCPFCDSLDIIRDSIETDDNENYRSVNCNNCLANWTEIFGLKDIEINEVPQK